MDSAAAASGGVSEWGCPPPSTVKEERKLGPAAVHYSILGPAAVHYFSLGPAAAIHSMFLGVRAGRWLLFTIVFFKAGRCNTFSVVRV